MEKTEETEETVLQEEQSNGDKRSQSNGHLRSSPFLRFLL